MTGQVMLGSDKKSSDSSKKTGNTVASEARNALHYCNKKMKFSRTQTHNKAYSVNQTQSSSTYYVNQRN